MGTASDPAGLLYIGIDVGRRSHMVAAVLRIPMNPYSHRLEFKGSSQHPEQSECWMNLPPRRDVRRQFWLLTPLSASGPIERNTRLGGLLSEYRYAPVAA